MDAPNVWVATSEGTEIIRAQDIAAVVLDYNGNVTARLAGWESPAVTLVAHRTHRDEHRPGDLHRQLLRVVAQLSDASGSHLVRPEHEDSHGWKWVTEPL